ncbi:ethanolamine ammonia-lyase subunit EutC [Gayadomonas joobiniege]|uniref:ethanolamine ammonia-lyase subunit EutC n=1 Tax=Gayadomonas joobiniege TaxID=1234606 RepID=UPI00036406D3|nr:ethanolamine ammonia-lyase subunit EutC [Gayadomonas joobiniege]
MKAIQKKQIVKQSPWQKLRSFTDARIALGRAGSSVPTAELLKFQLAHAQAIDAVHSQLPINQLAQSLPLPSLKLQSQAIDRMQYLQRPDLGRRLSETSYQQLVDYRMQADCQYDLVIAICDGLSAAAIEHHAAKFIRAFLTSQPPSSQLKFAPIAIVEQGRVAAGDDVCEALKAKAVLLLVGERPGLSSPDSLGLYLTWQAKRGCKDAFRNCISNVRPAGLSYQEAADKAWYLLAEAKKLGTSGVAVKDRTSVAQQDSLDGQKSQSFLSNNTERGS